MSTIEETFGKLDMQLLRFKKEFAEETIRRVKERTPVRSGHLRDGWGYDLESDEITFHNNVEYASFIEYGTRHIAPRAMWQTTVLEVDAIADAAAKKAGLK